MPSLTVIPAAPTPADEQVYLPPKVPDLPPDVKERFSSLEEWNQDVDTWWRQASQSITGAIQDLASAANTNSITITEVNQSLNTKIDGVGQVAGGKNAIYVQSSAPTSPKTGDLWVNTSDSNKYEFWNGSSWQYEQDLVLAAAVSAESSARATADGFLSAKYTLTVVAGNVVTGMNITSSSGGGTNISNVTFQASSFLIYNGSAGAPVFAASGGNVYLANTLVVDQTNAKVYIGTGTYATAGTQFYVDSSGRFSMGDKLTWDGSTLTVGGMLNASEIATNCVAYNTGHPAATFPTVCLQNGSAAGGSSGNTLIVTYYGYGTTSGFSDDLFGANGSQNFLVTCGGNFSLSSTTNSYSVQLIYRINGGGWSTFGRIYTGVNIGSGTFILAFGLTISLASTDQIDFGISITGLVAATLTSADMAAVCFNL